MLCVTRLSLILNFEKCSIINKIKYIITKIGTEKIFTSRKEEKIAVLPDISEAKWFKIKKLIKKLKVASILIIIKERFLDKIVKIYGIIMQIVKKQETINKNIS